jgi:DNA-binding response OmpR family regulator
MAAIFLVEDDLAIREAITRALTDEGHHVRTAVRALDALREVMEWAPDAVVLDLGLPDLDGGDMLKMLRAVSDVPVIVTTARDDDSEIVRVLDAGADDYMVKPFSSRQLDARLRAVLRRRTQPGGVAALEAGPLRVDVRSRTATLDGADLELSRKEFDLLAYLAQRQGEVVSKRELLAEVWRQPYGGTDKTVDVHLSWLRRKLGESADAPRLLHTVRGVGVKLTAG